MLRAEDCFGLYNLVFCMNGLRIKTCFFRIWDFQQQKTLFENEIREDIAKENVARLAGE